MQTTFLRIWTSVSNFLSYDNNRYTKRATNLHNLRFGLVSSFNGISTFVGFIKPKPLLKNSGNTI